MNSLSSKTGFSHITFHNICKIFLLFFLSACEPAELTVDEALDEARELQESGDRLQAIQMLEAYNEVHPGEKQILEELAFDYAGNKNSAMAAMYFMELSDRTSEVEYLVYAAQSMLDTGDTNGAIDFYKTYLNQRPNDIGIWKTLIDLLHQQGDPDGELAARLQLYKLEKDGAAAVKIAQLFLNSNNKAQARAWFETAVRHKDASFADAKIGLLEVALLEKRLADAEMLVANLDQYHPGVLDQSHLAGSRADLLRWRESQNAVKEATAALQVESVVQADLVETSSSAPAGLEPGSTVAPLTTEQSISVQVEETDGVDELIEEDDELIESYMSKQDALDQMLEEDLGADDVSEHVELEEQPKKKTRRDWIIEGINERENGNFKKSIQAFRTALSRNDRDAKVWYELSESHFLAGEMSWAENTSLEAMRHDEDNLKYVFHFLKVTKQKVSPVAYVNELLRVRKKFPDNPEITLELARAYKEIRNKRNAARCYKLFLEQAPEHSQAPDAQMELDMLR